MTRSVTLSDSEGSSLTQPRHCEEGALPDEAISLTVLEIASSPYGLLAMTEE